MQLQILHAPLLTALVCVSAVFAASSVQAQVLRCTDARTGKVTYTDGACDQGARSLEVQPRKSAEEIAEQRALGDAAAQRMRERLAADADAARQRETQKNREEQDARQVQQNSASDFANSAACANARRTLDTVAASVGRSGEDPSARMEAAQRQMDFSCLGPEGYARTEAARANRPQVVVVPPPAWPLRPRPSHRPDRPDRPDRPHIKECSSFTCTDSNGKRYPRTGRGSFQER